MKQTIYQVDAFTNRIFEGNPAAVCPLEEWPAEDMMQKIATENNLSETAFFIKSGNEYEIRWFTPATEVDLCGHATLASAHVIFNHMNYEREVITFKSRSGKLGVIRKENLLVLDFPTAFYNDVPVLPGLVQALGEEPTETCLAKDYLLAAFDSEEKIRKMTPDFSLLRNFDYHVVIVTATAKDSDFVSRVFAPVVGINEDPVTGSAHTLLTPYWSQKLGKISLHAMQISSRGGELFCKLTGERVEIGGEAVTYLVGEIELPE